MMNVAGGRFEADMSKFVAVLHFWRRKRPVAILLLTLRDVQRCFRNVLGHISELGQLIPLYNVTLIP